MQWLTTFRHNDVVQIFKATHTGISESTNLRQVRHGFFDFMGGKGREAIFKREVGKITCIHQPKECVTKEGVIVNVISAPDAIVCERTVVAHHLYACMAPAAVMGASASDPPTLDTHLVSFDEVSVANELILVLWISRTREHGHVVVENSVGHHVVGEEDVKPP